MTHCLATMEVLAQVNRAALFSGQNLMRLVGGELQRQNISLASELSADLGPVIGDRVQVQQVILNLVVNGIEAMTSVLNRPRTLRISTRLDPSGLLLMEVADVGTGLDPANVDRIFDGFFTTKPEGIGMGLAISRSIIEAHLGVLWAAPNQPHGSIFQFTMTPGHHAPGSPCPALRNVWGR